MSNTPEQPTALVPVEQKAVNFYDQEITAVLVEQGERRQVYVPLRPICDSLGVDWSGQRQRILRDPVLSEALQPCVVVTPTQGEQPDQRREVQCLPLDYLNGWLFGINANRVKDEIRDRLIRYQKECYQVLAEAFMPTGTMIRPAGEGDDALVQLHNMALVIAATTREMLAVRQLALDNESRLDAARDYIRGINQRLRVVEQRTQAGPLTEEQAREIQNRVNLIAQELTKRDPAQKHYPGVYEALRHETGATSYKTIPLRAYDAALAFLDGWLESIQEAEAKDG
jgi:hypothetical protein